MAVINYQDLIDAAADAQSLEDVVNGAANINGTGIVTTRLGQQLKTLAKIQSDAALTGVLATNTFANDNRLIRSDSTNRNVKASGITIDDSNNMTGILGLGIAGNITVSNSSPTINFQDTDDSLVSSIYGASGNLVLNTSSTAKDILFVANNVEKARMSGNGYLTAKRINSGSPNAAASPADGDINGIRYLLNGIPMALSGADDVAQLYMELSEQKSAPIDMVLGYADSFKTNTLIDLTNSVAINWVSGYISNEPTGGALIPLMTSNTAPSGTATGSSSYGAGYEAYRAFDRSNANAWMSAAGSTGTLEYEFPAAVTASHYTVQCDSETTRAPNTWTFQGYNTGTSSWDTLDTRSGVSGWATNQRRFYAFASNQTYKRFRINVTAHNGGGYVKINNMQLYFGNCPVLTPMTSDTTPVGTWTYSHTYGGYSTDKLSDENNSSYWSTNVAASVGSPVWGRYTLGSSLTVSRLMLGSYSSNALDASMPRDFTIKYHNGTSWVTALTVTGVTWSGGNEYKYWDFPSAVTSPTGAFELNITATNGGNVAVAEMQLYTPKVTVNGDLRTLGRAQGSNPSSLDVYVLINQIDAITLGTDLKIYGTRDNGANWVEGSYQYVGHGWNGTLYKATCNVSGQAADNRIAARVTTHNLKRIQWFAHCIKGI